MYWAYGSLFWCAFGIWALGMLVSEYVELRLFHCDMLDIMKLTRAIKRAMRAQQPLPRSPIPEGPEYIPIILNELKCAEGS